MNKMEITKEIKDKLFVQYWGQFVLRLPNNDDKLKVIDWFKFDNAHLVLKSLSKITDEDAKQVSIVGLPHQDYIWCATSGKDLVNVIDRKKCWSFYYKNADWFAIKQKLIDLGYDVFNPLIGNKTLQEVGLAIYE
jgi:hypothetical protein